MRGRRICDLRLPILFWVDPYIRWGRHSVPKMDLGPSLRPTLHRALFLLLPAEQSVPMQSSHSSEVTLPPVASTRRSKEAMTEESGSNLERDIEKGDPAAPDNNEVDEGVEDKRQTKEEDNIIGWDGPDDPGNPQNWSRGKKLATTLFYASMTFCITFASSVFSTATEVTAAKFHVSTEVMTLGTALFVLVWI